VTWRQWVLASLLWGGEEACVSHRAAARLLGLDGVDRAPAEISLRWRRRSPHPDVVVRSTDSLLGQDVVTLAPFRLTGATRTLIDLGWLVDEKVLERALDDALRRGLTTIPRLRFRINQLRGHGRRGVAAIARLVEERDPRLPIPESLLEARVIRLLRAAGLPAPVRQHAVSADGRVIARLDLAYPEVLLAIECDGYRYHPGKAAWESDLRRRNLLTALGWRVLHFTWDDVERKPADVAGRVGVALARFASP
jgi:very-short-patch-repair endonuclease